MQSQEESCLVHLGKDENIEIKPKLGSVFSSILLTPDGFIEGDTFHSWHDIEQFGLTNKILFLTFFQEDSFLELQAFFIQ